MEQRRSCLSPWNQPGQACLAPKQQRIEAVSSQDKANGVLDFLLPVILWISVNFRFAMEPLTPSSASLYTPSSENDKYFGYYHGTIGIYPCHPSVTRQKLLNHISEWLDEEIGTPPNQLRKISSGGRTVWELTQPRESGVQIVKRKLPRSWYEVPEKEEKAKAMNLGGLALVAANKIVGGSRDVRTEGLIAVSDGAAKELLVPMARYRKAEPGLEKLSSMRWDRYHAQSADVMAWGKCISSLQRLGMVENKPCAIWGPEQQSEPWATRKGATEHAGRIVFVGLYDELLQAVEGFRLSLSPDAKDMVQKKKEVRFKLEGDEGEEDRVKADEGAEEKDAMEIEK